MRSGAIKQPDHISWSMKVGEYSCLMIASMEWIDQCSNALGLSYLIPSFLNSLRHLIVYTFGINLDNNITGQKLMLAFHSEMTFHAFTHMCADQIHKISQLLLINGLMRNQCWSHPNPDAFTEIRQFIPDALQNWIKASPGDATSFCNQFQISISIEISFQMAFAVNPRG